MQQSQLRWHLMPALAQIQVLHACEIDCLDCFHVCSTGRADASAHIMALLLDNGHPVAVLDTLTEMDAPESSKAVSQVLLRLADQNRYDVLADVRAVLKPISAPDDIPPRLVRSLARTSRPCMFTRCCHIQQLSWHGV